MWCQIKLEWHSAILVNVSDTLHPVTKHTDSHPPQPSCPARKKRHSHFLSRSPSPAEPDAPHDMRSKPETQTATATTDPASSTSVDPIFHLLRILPFSFLRAPKLRLKLPTLTLPSPMTVYALVLLTYFMVVSGIVYDVIVEPPGIGSTQDRATGAVRPVVFLQGRVNGQYIVEGLSSGFMFVLGGIGIVLMDLALDRNRAKSVKVSYATAGIASVVIAYVMSMLFIRIKIPAYLR
ncbi:Oligosaccharyltransferase complex subunit ostc [Morella rubra]|uniref:Oligosaccharyltransferase complex subunit ostc n=1 Tax=Morella rubra TaxID=262757 RepID=A0A6A1UV21_9ROSI|nr:Oligosaccharyltransferase complex subunit ostc [Morella rubra]